VHCVNNFDVLAGFLCFLVVLNLLGLDCLNWIFQVQMNQC